MAWAACQAVVVEEADVEEVTHSPALEVTLDKAGTSHSDSVEIIIISI